VKLLIVDDEAPARERLRRLLQEIGPPYRVVGEAASGEAALALAHEQGVDLVLMDIRMPGLDGLATAARLAKAQTPPAVIFTTAYDEHALAAFEHQAVDYLLKPIRKQRLARALERAQVLTAAQLDALGRAEAIPAGTRQSVCATYRGGVQTIPISEIRFFRAEEKYVVARHGNGEILLEEPLKALEEDFAEQFLRIHRNALVAKAYLRGLEKGADDRFRACLESGEKLEVSRRHVAAVRGWLRSRGA